MRLPIACLPLMLIAACTATDQGVAGYDRLVFSAVNSTGPQLPRDYTDRVSGNYKGQPVTTKRLSTLCPPDTESKIEIGDATVYFAYRPDALFIAPVQQDGTVHAVAGDAILDGVVREGTMRMTVTTPVCETRYRMRWLS